MMTKELRKLSRRELVDIIYQLKKNEQQMQEEIAALQEALQDKRIHISSAGSIAQAAVEISQVMAAAQEAADLYLQEIEARKAAVEEECAKMIEDAKKKVRDTLSDGAKQYTKLNTYYQMDVKKLQRLREEIQKLEQQKKEGF